MLASLQVERPSTSIRRQRPYWMGVASRGHSGKLIWYRSVPLVSFLWWPNLPELCEKQNVVHDLQSAAEDEGPAKHRHAEQVSGKRWTDRGGQAARHRGDAGRGGPFLGCHDRHDIG